MIAARRKSSIFAIHQILSSPNFCNTKSFKKVGRHGERAKIAYEKSTLDSWVTTHLKIYICINLIMEKSPYINYETMVTLCPAITTKPRALHTQNLLIHLYFYISKYFKFKQWFENKPLVSIYNILVFFRKFHHLVLPFCFSKKKLKIKDTFKTVVGNKSLWKTTCVKRQNIKNCLNFKLTSFSFFQLGCSELIALGCNHNTAILDYLLDLSNIGGNLVPKNKGITNWSIIILCSQLLMLLSCSCIWLDEFFSAYFIISSLFWYLWTI